MRITVNQTNRWAGSMFWRSVWSPVNFKEKLPALREALIKAGCAKNVGKERKVKITCWWKMPTQGRSARGKNRILNKWKCRNSLCDGLGWKYKMRSKNLSNSPRNGEGWCWKAMRRTTTKWRTSTNEDTTTTTKMKIKNEQQQHKSLTGGFPKQVKLLGVFDLIT